MEVICISSDDESDSQKENKTDKFLTNSTESVSVLGKTESSVSDNEKTEQNSLKRKKLQTEDDINILEKKKRLNFDQNTPKVKNKPVSGLCSLYVTKVNLVKSDCNTQPNKKQEVAIEKQLIVKEKKKISYISQDVFPLFISLCLQKCPKYDRTDMNKIIDKLKRRYENLDPTYASSEHFVRYLNEKREAIASDSKQIYVHIEEVMNEMKKRARKKPQVLQSNEIYDAVPSTSYATNKISANNRVEVSYDDDNNEADDNEENAHETNRMIKKVLRTMEKCEARIKKLDEEEVDFNEENDSNYIKVERYKQKMVELYRKFCELTGENPDAGRVYLRPKHLNVTRIAVIDQAITNFINSKITRRNQMKRAGALINNLIFPDYRDIFECVNRCNERKNLGLDEDRRKRIAENAFKELGEHLQRVRRNDYWDTFSLYLENTEDPALKDKNLAKKLADNRSEGEKRLAAVFEKYYRKQLERKNQSSEESLSEEEDEDEGENEEEEEDEEEEEKESIINDEAKIEENLSMTSEKDSGNEEDIDETIKEKRLPLKKSESNISMVNVDHINVDVMDKDISNKAIATSQIKCKTVTIKVLKDNDMAKSKNEVKIVNMKTIKPYNSNIILKNVMGAKMQEDSPACSTTNCTKDLAEVEAIEVSKTITDPATKKVTNDATDTITRFTTKLITGDAAELITGDAAELITENATELITRDTVELITRDTAELTTEDATELITGDITKAENVAKVIANKTEMTIENVIGGSIENMSNDEQHEEEKKPVLRLRSFAKPPTTWEDSQHKVDKTTQEKASKESNQVKEIVDLTNEGIAKSPPIITKCTVQLGKIVPVVPVKRQTSTLVIPTNSNIISVQNITNNYLKVNTRTGRIIAPVRDIHGPTIIRLPIQSTSQQSQLQNTSTIAVKNDVSLKGKETILHFIPKNSIIISKKSPVQSVSKQTDVSSSTPTTKSK